MARRMMLITVADASGRRLLGRPIEGTYEFVSFMLCLLFFGSICYCGIEKGHLSLGVVTSLFPLKIRKLIVGIGRLFSFGLSWLIAWRLVVSALNEKAAGTHGMQLTSVPLYPFVFIGALGMVVIGWIFLVEALYSLGEVRKIK